MIVCLKCCKCLVVSKAKPAKPPIQTFAVIADKVETYLREVKVQEILCWT